MSATRRSIVLPSLTKLSITLGSLCLTLIGGGLALLLSANPGSPAFETAKWLLQLASIFAGTGVISAVLRQSEISRAQQESYARDLQELVTGHDRVQLAVRMLSAHATAKTYSEQIQKISEVREIIRHLTSSPNIHNEYPLFDALKRMRQDLKYLIKEYEDHYLPVARQQRVDEYFLTYRLKKLAEVDSDDFPLLAPHLSGPLPAGQILSSDKNFPCLNKFCIEYKSSDFRKFYEVAKIILEQKAGTRDRKDSEVTEAVAEAIRLLAAPNMFSSSYAPTQIDPTHRKLPG
ncbi:hypothetical protein ACWED2_45540 [Amycolatopsis sp. NPDC005003]